MNNLSDYRNHQNEIKSGCCGRRAPWELQPDRKILIGTPDKNIPNNRVQTSKYNIATFLPQNSLEQFAKISNLYFLMLGVLQIIPQVTTTDGQPTFYLPLIFIVIVSMVKDFFEDYKRHQADDEENYREAQRYSIRTGVFEYDKQQSLYVGDIVRIANKSIVPADVIVLASSKNSECFVETKNLDGETNLKPKYAPQRLNSIYQTLIDKELAYDIFIALDFERQNPLMYKFKGSFTLEREQKKQAKEPVNYDNFIERGCSLQNTDWILAVVVYTGHDTKIMMNSISGKIKYSNVEKAMGRQILWVFLFLVLECVFASTFYDVWYADNQNNIQGYLEYGPNDPEANAFYNFIIRFAQWFLLLGNSVPISLLVTLETVKFFQAQLIQSDKNYVFEDRHAEVHSSNLSEELGIVEYIFSDKTGTLTQNIMKFKSLTINGIRFGSISDKDFEQDEVDFDNEKFIPLRKPSANVDFNDSKLSIEIKKSLQTNKIVFTDHLMCTMLCLGFCHTVQTDIHQDEDLVYNASSPDELALVSFAKEMGFKYIGKEDNKMKLLITQNNTILRFSILQIIEFNSTRKRMSIVLKDEQNRIILFCKGADNVILSLLDEDRQDTGVLYETKRQLQEYATQGLRTLVLGMRELEAKEFEKFQSEYNRAQSIIDDEKLRESLMTQLEEMFENNLTLLCATAIEDKLQDQVGEVISDLKKAGIKVWVLTGDKIETAINIGYSCKLLTENIKQFIVDAELEASVERQLNKAHQYLDEHPTEQISLVVSGVALVIIIHNFAKLFFKIALQSNAVMACRVSPKQKQEVVDLVRRLTGKITLSIGDGANDVAMITKAHVGVGIRGLEGQQAAKSSDYAIGEFKQLRRLLFYSGHESYRKNSTLILYNFYKNQIFITVFFFYGFSNGFSAQFLYDQWLSQLFNVFFTSWPIILYALFDEQFPSSKYLTVVQTEKNTLEERPEIYGQYLIKPVFNMKAFWRWFFNGFIQAIYLLVICAYAFEPVQPHSQGYNSQYLEAGMTIMGSVVYIVNIRVIILHNTNYFILILVNILSSLSFLVFFLIFSQYTVFDSYNLFYQLFNCPNFYIATCLCIALTNFIDLGAQRFNYFRKRTIKEPKNRILELQQGSIED